MNIKESEGLERIKTKILSLNGIKDVIINSEVPGESYNSYN